MDWLSLGHVCPRNHIALCPLPSCEHLLSAWLPRQLPILHFGTHNLKGHSPGNWNMFIYRKGKSGIYLMAQGIGLTCSFGKFSFVSVLHNFLVCLEKNQSYSLGRNEKVVNLGFGPGFPRITSYLLLRPRILHFCHTTWSRFMVSSKPIIPW